jgi:hypothetical protein
LKGYKVDTAYVEMNSEGVDFEAVIKARKISRSIRKEGGSRSETFEAMKFGGPEAKAVCPKLR